MGGWRLKHQIIAEKALGRPLRENERCKFRDNDRTNLDPSNIEVVLKREKSNGTKRAQLEAKIEQLQAELAELDEE
jgi:hypothetical protein